MYNEYLRYVQTIYRNGDEEPSTFEEWIESKERR